MVAETNKEYHNNPAISKSNLHLISNTPQYYKWYLENPSEPTDSMKFGTALHKYILEPETFYDEVAIMPLYNLHTKEGRAQKLAFVEECEQEGKTDITQAQFDIIIKMADKLKDTNYISSLLVGEHEKSFYWTDTLTGIECKCRPDSFRYIGDRILIVDLKSCSSAEYNSIQRDVIKYGYDLQAYMYCKGLSENLNIPMDKIDFMFVFVCKEAPYMVNIMQADEFVIERGETLFREYIGTLKYCKDSDNWYGYNGRDGRPNILSLPKYLIKEINID